jgi:hypothetical protein
MALECPYCEKEIDDDDDFWDDPSDRYEVECPHCEKTFTMTVDYTKDYYPDKAPCLNGETPHVWKDIYAFPIEYFSTVQRCSICGRERDLRDITTA